ncbi:helix-turn-helix domain-containing protein [Haloarculaceae archaeon H-GB2-1]|nr:helix-turn-helix domain-containing protein [Haloarculaceae archaeon H-GB1-1]MEA5388802.1 helix-turn-helix domain-containing protein [Haloarculaceae archaeon H-GB11]MEA5406859.1 helix-turn-helix domain-containing protein [Haloarculaceae archaeon H-GB2-1]
MSLIADFSVPAESFCLEQTLDSVPEMTVELDRLAAHSPEYVMPFLWVLGDEWDRFEAALADDPTVVEYSVSDSFEDLRLYQFRWADVVTERLHVILDSDGTILEGRASGPEWRLQVRFGSREHFATFREYFEDGGPITLHQLTEPTSSRHRGYGLSEKQRIALLMAYDKGYYDVPRTATGGEVAGELGVTQQAVSARLRRAMATLIENTLLRYGDGGPTQ